jgi:integrase
LNLVLAIETYVKRKRDDGLDYGWCASYLAALSRQVGDVALERVTTREILTFLDGPKASPNTWVEKYHMVHGFFDFWLARGEIDFLPMPVKRKIRPRPFAPYIYTHTEIQLLLKAVRNRQKAARSKIDPFTLRAILIFLYGTGVRAGEAVRLLVEDVDLKKGEISIHGNRFNRSRTIPIGPDLGAVLKEYWDSRRRQGTKDDHFFQNKEGEGLNYGKLENAFRRLRRISGIRRHDDSRYQPRMYDLRHTFAAHRIAGWIKHGADLNRMLPALAVYMGLTGLRSTERYLLFAPERFRTQLIKLSPGRGKKRWRDDPELMRFLSGLSADGELNRQPNGDVSIRGTRKIVSPVMVAQGQLTRRAHV